MFKRLKLRIVLTLTICVVTATEGQQRGEQQKPCLTAREAFDLNDSKVPLCKKDQSNSKAPPSPAPPPPGTTSSAGIVPASATVSVSATASPAVSGPATQIGNQSGGSVVLTSLEYSPLVLKYSIQKLSGKDWVAADLNAEFRTDDHIKLTVEANQPAYLYVFAMGLGGTKNTLFPDARINGGDSLVPAHRRFEMPGADFGITFKPPAGQEHLVVILSRKAVRNIEELKNNSLEKGERPSLSEKLQIAQNITEETIDDIRLKSRDLVVEKISDSEIIVANGKGTADDSVLSDVMLNHL